MKGLGVALATGRGTANVNGAVGRPAVGTAPSGPFEFSNVSSSENTVVSSVPSGAEIAIWDNGDGRVGALRRGPADICCGEGSGETFSGLSASEEDCGTAGMVPWGGVGGSNILSSARGVNILAKPPAFGLPGVWGMIGGASTSSRTTKVPTGAGESCAIIDASCTIDPAGDIFRLPGETREPLTEPMTSVTESEEVVEACCESSSTHSSARSSVCHAGVAIIKYRLQA
jgi:hypothetical protein